MSIFERLATIFCKTPKEQNLSKTDTTDSTSSRRSSIARATTRARKISVDIAKGCSGVTPMVGRL